MKSKFYITTPLYYVNASPHIGHSYTTIAADVLSRYMRKKLGEENVWFLTGTDEHGQKIEKAAEAAKLTAQGFADCVVLKFKELWKGLNISYNDFIRTTEERHVKTVKNALEILYKKGDIYEDKYVGWYCTPCETFWIDSQVIDENCPDCKRKVERISETNYFFKLTKYQDWLLSYIKDNPDFIKPDSRKEEVLRFLELNKLNDLCISRPKERLSWGIPLPFAPGHVTYVWFDALVNYISAVGEFNADGKYQSRWWPAQLHLMAKDILRQHAVYWPIMLHALGIEMPESIFAHGWWMLEEEKISKSRGNVVNPVDIVRRYGLDAYRYFLLRDVPFGLDGNFSEEAVIKRYNSDLANDLGNLVYRTLTMIEKYFDGNIPDSKEGRIKYDLKGQKIINLIEGEDFVFKKVVGKAIEDYNFSQSLTEIWNIINLANKYVEETKPWNLAKESKQKELRAFITVLVKVIRNVAEELMPFMPDTSSAILEQLGKDKINKGDPLFPRLLS
ncbi:MAG: methionine--tRNA ligase [Candidatus Omnitrophica bacterium]|nr:methionine--tRNA ligase [Candidatus Omnitrophota bacterium]